MGAAELKVCPFPPRPPPPCLQANITTLGPLVLPISEQLLFFVNLVARKVRGGTRASWGLGAGGHAPAAAVLYRQLAPAACASGAGLTGPPLLSTRPPPCPPPSTPQVLRLKVRSYIPDFKLAFEHFCIHTGERQARAPGHSWPCLLCGFIVHAAATLSCWNSRPPATRPSA